MCIIWDVISISLAHNMPWSVMVATMEYIKSILNNFPEKITGSKTSPAVDHLFTERDPSLVKMLPEEPSETQN